MKFKYFRLYHWLNSNLVLYADFNHITKQIKMHFNLSLLNQKIY